MTPPAIIVRRGAPTTGRRARTIAVGPLAAVLVAVTVTDGCIHRASMPAPPHAVRAVTVLPPTNRTGDPLLMTGTSLLERYAFPTERVTVPDALAQETAAFLRARGYRVDEPRSAESTLHGRAPESAEDVAHLASNAGVQGFVLYLDIRRWEPEGDMRPQRVIVAVSATLVDTATGRDVWNARPPMHPVPTSGAVSVGAADDIAVRAVVAELFASW